jgi:large subunit ribosomal protein L24e
MTKCVFCGAEEQPFRGIHYIQNDGTVNFFCSSKCQTNALHLKRDKRKLKWTQSYREEKDKSAIRVSKGYKS